MSDENKRTILWRGRPLSELTREELIDACEVSAAMIESLHNSHARDLGFLAELNQHDRPAKPNPVSFWRTLVGLK